MVHENMGPCTITFNSVDLGTTHGDVKFKDKENAKDIFFDQKGDGPADAVVTGRVVEAEVPLANASFTILQNVINGATGAPGSLLVSNAVGKEGLVNSYILILTRIKNGIASTDPDDKVTINKAFPHGEFDWSFGPDGQRVVKVTFKCFPDNSGNYYRLGTA